ncbi:HlyD family secretion protein [Pseudomonas fluorescens]|uniref:HlyD family efflux transporter periplasmic adaptor subunit n=1 Tax=Pseudomonas fluorescens TaxID=294 RepID=A0A7Z6MSU7_PSEFL|nr:efflux RND transporter periplasmic adaptor subunit [Pseudomonas fluorescens]RDS87729.1 HlyD family efflux transporter periplasmic adaptor subunit [Pseudomonas fluorescens]
MSKTAITSRKKLIVAIALICAVVPSWYLWTQSKDHGPGEGFVSGNGRIEATEIDIATKLAGRVSDILVREGDFVIKGQPLARMQVETLQAQRDEAVAAQEEARHAIAAAQAQVAQRQSDVAAQQAVVSQRLAELEASKRRLARSETLSREGAASLQELDDDRASMRSTDAALVAARAQVVALQAAVDAAKAQHTGAQARLVAAQASVARIAVDITDSELKSPRDGRVQFRVAQPGEVLAGGGRLLNLVDLSEVYMTFFLPETIAGRVALGSEVRIVLDVAPQTPIPATVSFVSSIAQFTPKTVETASERQKLMFRVRAQIAPELLKEHLEQVKTGLPGVAWVKLDRDASWPASLNGSLTAR